jgi:hypothetical protein
MVRWGGMDPDSRAQTAAQHIQTEVEETNAVKQGPAILVFALKALEKLDIKADPR